MRHREEAQTVVIGSLLLLGLAVGLVVFVQVSILPDVNERDELDSQESSLRSMIDLRSELQTNLATGVSKSMLFRNSVTYLPQPAAPPDQFGQLNFGSGEMAVRNAEIKVGETENSSGDTVDVTEPLRINEEDNSESLDDVVTVYEYIPSYIELTSEDRTIKMDNTVIYENNPAENRIRHADQSFITGRNIDLVGTNTNVDGVKQQRDISLVINTQYKINGPVRGAGGSDIVIETYTTEDESEWSSIESNPNVNDVSVSGNELRIVLDSSPENSEYYNFDFVRNNIEAD